MNIVSENNIAEDNGKLYTIKYAFALVGEMQLTATDIDGVRDKFKKQTLENLVNHTYGTFNPGVATIEEIINE